MSVKKKKKENKFILTVFLGEPNEVKITKRLI